MNRYKICVIPAFPLENVQLLKDRVLLPYVYYRAFGESLRLVTKCTEEYPYLPYLKGAELIPLPKDAPHMESAVRYVSEHSRDIDLLFLFGARGEYMELAHTYKSLRPDGIIYLKLDTNIDWANAYPLYDNNFSLFLQNCDIISCETRRLQSFLCKKWLRPVEYIPNGVYYPLYPEAADIQFADKENIILTVGRLGTAQKNSMMLLYAYALAFPALKEPWKLVMAGSVTPSFQADYDNFCKEFPPLAPHIHLTGNITDKQTLYQYYKKAKIFALSSRAEGGSPNVFSEAAIFGCTVITTDVDASPDMTDNGRLGRVSPHMEDVESFSGELLTLCQDSDYLARNFHDMRTYMREFFDYERLADRLRILVELQAFKRRHSCI
ncbi:MAG: glycosyltransferase family 4 protein [Lachnospiraceae bacterium]|nr:glycosyltransferase family 4 protein [Lachnospiraceae bacterium]